MDRKLVIIFILLLIVLKIPALFNPLLGNFSTKQTTFATIARNFAEDGEVLYPKIDYIIDGEKSLHLLELPYPAYLTGIVWKILGGSLDFWGRFVNLCFFLFSLRFLYLFSRQLLKDEYLSLIVCTTFLLLPITSIYSVSFQMEGAMLFFLFGSLYYFFKWYDDKFQFPFMWFVFSIFLLLLKPHAVIYYLLPLGSLFLWKYKIKVFRQQHLYIMILPVIPVMLWVLHVKNITTADNNIVFYSLVDSVGTRRFPPPLLFEASFYKDIFDKLSGLLFTPLGFTLFLIGFCTSYKSKNMGFVYIWGLFTLLYVFLLPRKMIELSYYLLPVGCVGIFFIAFAVKVVVENKSFLRLFEIRTGKVFLGIAILVISFRYSFAPMFTIPEYDRHVVGAGKYIDENTLRNSLVVASHGTSTDLLYYCNRTGWSFSVKRERLAQTFTPQELVYFKKRRKRIFSSPQEYLDYLIKEHNASYFVCTPKRDLKANKVFFEYLQTNFSLLEETDGFIIYSLKKR